MVEHTHVRILLVEDNPGDAELIEAYLEPQTRMDARVHLVETMSDALDAVAGPPEFDLALLDLTLPDSEGLDTLRRVRAAAPDLPIIILTGMQDTELAWAAIREGANDYVPKGDLTPDLLARSVRYAVDRAKAAEALRRKDVILDAVGAVAEQLLTSDDLNDVLPGVLEALGNATEMGTADLWEIPSSSDDESRPQPTLRFQWTAGEERSSSADAVDPIPTDEEWLRRLREGDPVYGTARELSGPAWRTLEGKGVQAVALLPVMVRGQLWGCLGFTDRNRASGWSEPEVDALGAAAATLGAAIQQREDQKLLRQRDELLLQALKMDAVGRLAGGIAHDFNNLLTAVGGHASLLSERVEGDEEGLAAVEEIERAAERGGRLTQQLLAFSRQQVIEKEVVNLGEVVADSQRLLDQIIGEDIHLVTRVIEDTSVFIDRSQVQQILTNLVLNARDAVSSGGRIEVSVDGVTVDAPRPQMLPAPPSPGEYAKLVVKDDGCGMDGETLKRVFEPFYTTKAPDRGTGLGLATVYAAVETNGGCIGLDSQPGGGTTVTILLPASDEARARETDLTGRRGSGTDSAAGATILVVDDERAVRQVAVRTLSREGYGVLEASNGREALALVDPDEVQVDLLLTDVIMPEMGGMELAERMRERYPKLKVVLTSGYTEDELVQEGVDAEEATFLPKPYRPADVRSKVATTLQA